MQLTPEEQKVVDLKSLDRADELRKERNAKLREVGCACREGSIYVRDGCPVTEHVE